MDLSQLGIVARERTPWEAVDLGILLARKWYRPLVIGWLLPSLIVFVAFSVLFHEWLWLGMLITWWLKPLWDRVPLFMASRALFGETITAKGVLRAWLGFTKKDGFAWLTWRRFSPTRAFDMPVTVLEGISGEARQKRLRVLHINTSGAATWLTIVCVHVELAIILGGIGLIYLFIPDEVDFSLWVFLGSEERFTEILLNLMTYVAMVLVAPFYTLAGFALYISRRITLEGWDIELRFRQLADRQSSRSVSLQHEQATKTNKVASCE